MKNKMPVHKAFLLQACEDYQASAIILAHLQNGGEKTYKESRPLFLSTPFCGAPFFMLLQMSVEKLSKAAYCKARGIAGKLPPKEHDFVLFLEAVLARNPNFQAFRDRHASTFRFLREELNTRQPSNVRKHMENLEYISSAGLRVLLSAQKTMNGQGSMKVINVSDTIMEIFEITGFNEIMTIK